MMSVERNETFNSSTTPPEEAANQLMGRARELVLAIPKSEYYVTDAKDKDNRKNLDKANNYASRLANLITSDLISIQDDTQRNEQAIYWLNIMDNCLKNDDYFTAFSTYTALMAVKGKLGEKIDIQIPKQTSELFNAAGQSKTLRETMENKKSAIIPSFAAYGGVMTTKTDRYGSVTNPYKWTLKGLEKLSNSSDEEEMKKLVDRIKEDFNKATVSKNKLEEAHNNEPEKHPAYPEALSNLYEQLSELVTSIENGIQDKESLKKSIESLQEAISGFTPDDFHETRQLADTYYSMVTQLEKTEHIPSEQSTLIDAVDAHKVVSEDDIALKVYAVKPKIGDVPVDLSRLEGGAIREIATKIRTPKYRQEFMVFANQILFKNLGVVGRNKFGFTPQEIKQLESEAQRNEGTIIEKLDEKPHLFKDYARILQSANLSLQLGEHTPDTKKRRKQTIVSRNRAKTQELREVNEQVSGKKEHTTKSRNRAFAKGKIDPAETKKQEDRLVNDLSDGFAEIADFSATDNVIMLPIQSLFSAKDKQQLDTPKKRVDILKKALHHFSQRRDKEENETLENVVEGVRKALASVDNGEYNENVDALVIAIIESQKDIPDLGSMLNTMADDPLKIHYSKLKPKKNERINETNRDVEIFNKLKKLCEGQGSYEDYKTATEEKSGASLLRKVGNLVGLRVLTKSLNDKVSDYAISKFKGKDKGTTKISAKINTLQKVIDALNEEIKQLGEQHPLRMMIEREVSKFNATKNDFKDVSERSVFSPKGLPRAIARKIIRAERKLGKTAPGELAKKGVRAAKTAAGKVADAASRFGTFAEGRDRADKVSSTQEIDTAYNELSEDDRKYFKLDIIDNLTGENSVPISFFSDLFDKRTGGVIPENVRGELLQQAILEINLNHDDHHIRNILSQCNQILESDQSQENDTIKNNINQLVIALHQVKDNVEIIQQEFSNPNSKINQQYAQLVKQGELEHSPSKANKQADAVLNNLIKGLKREALEIKIDYHKAMSRPHSDERAETLNSISERANALDKRLGSNTHSKKAKAIQKDLQSIKKDCDINSTVTKNSPKTSAPLMAAHSTKHKALLLQLQGMRKTHWAKKQPEKVGILADLQRLKAASKKHAANPKDKKSLETIEKTADKIEKFAQKSDKNLGYIKEWLNSHKDNIPANVASRLNSTISEAEHRPSAGMNK